MSRQGLRSQFVVFRTALPLGIVLMLGSLNMNLPRYAIERYLGTTELGVFAAVASFITVGSTLINAVGQAASPRLARHALGRELRRFRRLSLQLSGLAIALGLAGVAAAFLLGGFVLSLVYRPDYAQYRSLLVAVMCAAMLQYLAIMLGYIITSTRAFVQQIPLLSAAVTTSAAASLLFVPRFGLNGAVLVLAAAGCVQVAGALLILRRAVRRLESAV